MDPAGIPGAPRTNGESSLHELFTLSDEQILEIEPGAADTAPVGQPFLAVPVQSEEIVDAKLSPGPSRGAASESATQAIQQNAQAGMPVPPEPPPWLAAQMKDPWSGEEAREFWNGVQQARTEAAACQAYRAAIASPEDARALKELYPSGVNEARNAAQRARLLDEMDRAYFGAAENSPEQTSAARAQLAQHLLREDPAAFREMVVAGLRALEQAEQGSGASAPSDLPRLAKLFAGQSAAINLSSRPEQTGPGRAAEGHELRITGHESRVTNHESPVASHESLSAYAAFERAANEDLEHSVGSAIERTLEQALPVAQPLLAERSATANVNASGAQAGVPALQQRLSAAIRQDIEKALQGDRQLGEQVAQILASRRFDDSARAQVVRLINERAQQLVPGATKRILNDWTQTTLAAHRSRTQRNAANGSHVEVAPVNAEPRRVSLPARNASTRAESLRQSSGQASASSRRVDYRKFSDEQILDMS